MNAATVAQPSALANPVRALVAGAAFANYAGVRASLAAIRATGTASDIVGLAVPLPGDPRDDAVAGEVWAAMTPPTGLAAWLRLVIDPHAPTAPTYREQIAGRNVPLAYAILGEVADWVGATGYMRVLGDAGASVWILGRPNHAASVQGGLGSVRGDALSTVGVPVAQREAFRALVLAGKSVVTTCETDPGRASRDAAIFRRYGGGATFVHPITSTGASGR
jgi:hypothetical protein